MFQLYVRREFRFGYSNSTDSKYFDVDLRQYNLEETIYTVQKVAYYDGSVWNSESLDFSNVTMYAVDTYQNKTAFGFDGTINATISETSIDNIGSAPSYPIMYINGPGTLNYIYNETTDQIIQFTGLVLGADETVTLDCRIGYKSMTSTTRNNVPKYSVRDNFNEFVITPGSNIIHLNADVTVTGTIKYTPLYTSIDDI